MLRVLMFFVVLCLPLFVLGQYLLEDDIGYGQISGIDVGILGSSSLLENTTGEVTISYGQVDTGASEEIQSSGVQTTLETSGAIASGLVYEITGDNSGTQSVGTGSSGSGQALGFGDIQIIEIFPSSGNCLDEFIILQSKVAYSGFVSIYGLGQSASVLSFWLEFEPGSKVVISDNIAGMIPTDYTFLTDSITLTNAGETLKLLVSGTILDEVVYSDLVGAQSLVFTATSGSQRIFKTNVSGSPATTCNTISPLHLSGGPGLCDIVLDKMDYQGYGIYKLGFYASGGTISGNSLQRTYSGTSIAQVYFETTTQLGATIIDLHVMSGGQTICYDQFVFASQYDITVVKSNNNSSGSVCTSSSSSSISISTDTIDSTLTTCGLRIQNSSIGFFAGTSFNPIATFSGKDLTDSQKTYVCHIDMGDGTILHECNPSSYSYKNPGIYASSIVISQKSSEKEICRSQTTINVATKLSDTITKNEIQDSEDEYPIVENLSGVYSGSRLEWFSLLANPAGSDSLFEEFSLINSGPDTIDLSNYSIYIGTRRIGLTGNIIGGTTQSWKGGRGFRNDGMCVSLYHSLGLVDRRCYQKVKEGQLIYRSGDESQEDDSVDSSTIPKTKKSTLKLNLKEAGPDKKLQTTVAKEKTATQICNEKIAVVKLKDKQKYETLKLARSKDKASYKQQLEKVKLKELVARNNRYLYENMSNYMISTISTQWPGVSQEGGFTEFKGYAQQLENLIRSGYIYTYKDFASSTYKYTNNFKQYVNSQEETSLLDMLLPGVWDYVYGLSLYDTNDKIVNALLRL